MIGKNVNNIQLMSDALVCALFFYFYFFPTMTQLSLSEHDVMVHSFASSAAYDGTLCGENGPLANVCVCVCV